MGSEELLVLGMAVPPMVLAAGLWWSARHAVVELRQSSVSGLPHGDGLGSGAAVFARAEKPAGERRNV